MEGVFSAVSAELRMRGTIKASERCVIKSIQSKSWQVRVIYLTCQEPRSNKRAINLDRHTSASLRRAKHCWSGATNDSALLLYIIAYWKIKEVNLIFGYWYPWIPFRSGVLISKPGAPKVLRACGVFNLVCALDNNFFRNEITNNFDCVK